MATEIVDKMKLFSMESV